MLNYLELLKDVMDNGLDKDDRTGIGTRSVFGRSLRFDLSEGFPILTTRQAPLRIAFEETMFFARGYVDTKILEDKNINIWKGNTSREFLDSHNLHTLPEGNMGKGYGFQWRNFGGHLDKDGQSHAGVDQLRNLINGLRDDPNGRRHIVTAWNPLQLAETPLPPCHIMHQYVVNDGKLDSCFYMRKVCAPL